MVTIPTSVRAIGCNAFEKCSSLIDVSITSSVNVIGAAAFAGCNALNHITVPASIDLQKIGIEQNVSVDKV